MHRHLIGALALLALAIAPQSFAQDKKPDEDKKQEQPAAKQEAPKKDPKTEEYEKAVKDLKKHEGAFVLYTRKKDILLELPESKLNNLFFIQAALNTGAGGGAQAGDPLGMFAVDAFRWEKHDEQVWIVRPNFRFRWDKNDPLAVASQRSFPEAILGGYRIEQTDPEKKLLLVNVTSLFQGEVFRLQEVVNMGVGGNYSLDREKSGVDTIKSFDENTVVRMGMHYISQRGGEVNPMLMLFGLGGNFLEDSRSAPLKVTYNLWYRKPSDYRPRIADPRVGYFTEDFYSLNRFLDEDRTQRYIMRYNLKKKDPTAKLSEPVKPIVWYIDNSVPKQYRDAVRDGVLAWNKAYEQIGYKNALEVREAPDNDPNWDHADGRFNVIRWTMSPDAGYAVALFRTDPFTGEVLNASVTFDSNMLFFAQQEQERFVVPAATAIKLGNEALLRNPSDPLLPVRKLWNEIDPSAQAAKAFAARMGWQFNNCSYQRDVRPHAAFAWNAIEASGIGLSKEEYAKQFIREIIMHEIGHCIGLRHNFVASTNLSTEQLADAKLVGELGVTASVMDYNPANVQGVFKRGVPFYSQVVGPYDTFAVRYGYCDHVGHSPEGEKHHLSQIARESGKAGNAFMTDEDADSFNPYVVRFDNGKDPLKYAARMLEASKKVRNYAVRNLPKHGESYAKRTQLIMGSYNSMFRQGRLASRFVGGVVLNRSYAGDIGAKHPIGAVDSASQWDALRLITRECLSLAAIDVPESVLATMVMSFDSPQGSQWTAPFRDILSAQQIMLYSTLMSASTCDRILENQFRDRSAKKPYTIDGHMGAIVAAVFEDVGQNRPINSVRRDLQRFAINGLITQATAPQGSISDDVRMLATDVLKRLDKRFETQLKSPKGLDKLTTVHLTDMCESIHRFKARQMTGGR